MSSFFIPRFLLSCVTLALFFLQSPSYAVTDDYYAACSTLYNCGKIKNVGFPFWGQGRRESCGYPDLYLNCSDGLTFITIQNVTYLVLDAKPEQQILSIVRFDLTQSLCPNQLLNASLDLQLFENVPETKNFTLLYGCPSIPSLSPLLFHCPKDGFHNPFAYLLSDNIPEISALCSTSVVVPVKNPTSLVDLHVLGIAKKLLSDGFEIKWIAGIVDCGKCQIRGGVCGYDWDSNKITCYYIKGTSAPQPRWTPQPQGTSGDLAVQSDSQRTVVFLAMAALLTLKF